MISSRRLEICTIRRELIADLIYQFLHCERQPCINFGRARQIGCSEKKPDYICKIVIGMQFLIPFQVVHHVTPMLINTAHENLLKLRIKLSARGSEQIVCQDPVGNSDADVHCAYPIHPKTRRISTDEVQNLIAKLVRVNAGELEAGNALLRKSMGPGDLGQMLHTSQLPRHFDVYPRPRVKTKILVPSLL